MKLNLVAIILLALSFIWCLKAQKSSEKRRLLAVVFTVIIVASLYAYNRKEGFHFEVTPWKRDCPFCPRGYNGMPIDFQYTGDAERLRMSRLGCGRQEQGLPNRARDYYTLGTVEDTAETDN